jgi:hypothetical protein
MVYLRHYFNCSTLDCPHMCCNFRRRFFVSLAFTYTYIKHDRKKIDVTRNLMGYTQKRAQGGSLKVCHNNCHFEAHSLLGAILQVIKSSDTQNGDYVRHWTYPFFEDIISYPLSRPKKWYNIISYITAKKRIGYYILYPYLQKFHKITLFFKEIKKFGKVTKELFRILSIYIRVRSLKEDNYNLFLYLSKKKCVL